MGRLLLLLLALVVASSACAEPFDACTRHLPFGVPSLADPDHTTPICYKAYAALHDDDLLVPRWVAYDLTGEHTLGCVKRTDNFHADANLPEDRRATSTDYKGSGYDKGHQAPAQDFAWNVDRMKESFSMVNIAPQRPGLNRAQWLRLEEAVRVWATDRDEVLVYVGPILLNHKRRLGTNHIAIPTAFWKAVIDPKMHDAVAFILPQQDIWTGNLEPWQVSLADIQRSAEIQLPLPPSLDIKALPPLWPVNLSAWNRKHKANCGD